VSAHCEGLVYPGGQPTGTRGNRVKGKSALASTLKVRLRPKTFPCVHCALTRGPSARENPALAWKPRVGRSRSVTSTVFSPSRTSGLRGVRMAE
jgi:hypothetical protein